MIRKLESRKQYKEGFPIHVKDDLLRGITYEELIDAVYSNIGSNANKNDVMKTYTEMLNDNIRDARNDLNTNMAMILKNIT